MLKSENNSLKDENTSQNRARAPKFAQKLSQGKYVTSVFGATRINSERQRVTISGRLARYNWRETLGTFRLDNEYDIEYEFSNLELLLFHTHLITIVSF